MTATHRQRAEVERLAHLRLLRDPPFAESDRDSGLEMAWQRRLEACELQGNDGVLRLTREGVYARETERGRWTMWSNVGRAVLMLQPDDGGPYGYVVTRTADGEVCLNDTPYVVRPAS